MNVRELKAILVRRSCIPSSNYVPNYEITEAGIAEVQRRNSDGGMAKANAS